ncbi:MAG TPA: type II toxin-antitoxin system prevent-host-death family antitoxin [Rhizomicrobium sp.]
MDHSLVHISAMRVPVSEAKGRLTDLVRRAEAGEEVVLTRHGQGTVKLVPVRAKPTRAEKAAALAALRKRIAKMKKSPGPSAARSQDFLYDKHGLPK